MRRPSMMMAGGPDITANGTVDNDATGTKVLSFATAQVGDLGIIHVFTPFGTNNATASGWARSTYTWPGPGYVSVLMWKVLTGADIASGVTVTSLRTSANEVGLGWAAYSGPNSAAIVGDAYAAASTSVSVAGFTKNSRCAGIVSILHERDGGVSPVPPTAMTLRHFRWVGGGGYGTIALADLLSADLYTGAALAWTGLSAAAEQIAVVIELRD